MSKILSVYPNCSLGGMTSVYIGRRATKPNTTFDFLFSYDRGGRAAFEKLENSSYRIVRKDRLKAYFQYVLANNIYNEIRITSLPELTEVCDKELCPSIIYEFHTSSLDVIEREIKLLKIENISEIWVPSKYLKGIIDSLLQNNQVEVKVAPNIVNIEVFTPDRSPNNIQFSFGEQPIFWVGRLDKGKNYKDFFRMLSLLPDKYHGYLILSLESDPARISEAILETEMYRINDRIHFLLNLTQNELADLYVSSYKHEGIFCSTSLAESFGYGVLEAALSGLPVVTYEVGGISGHRDYNLAIDMVNVGDTELLVDRVMGVNWLISHKKNIESRISYLKQFDSFKH